MSSQTKEDVRGLRERQEREKRDLRAKLYAAQMKLTNRRRATDPSDSAALKSIGLEELELGLGNAREFVDVFTRHVAELKALQRAGVFIDHEEMGVIEDGLKHHQYRVSDFETKLNADE